MKTKLKIIIPIIVAIAAVIIAAVCIKFNTNENYSIEAIMSTAQQYLTEQKYEPAIAEFEKAIQIDPRNVDAYIGIAQAYELISDTEKALEWLRKGFDITGDTALKAEIDRLGGLAEVEVTMEQTAEKTVESTTTPTEETTAVVEPTDAEIAEEIRAKALSVIEAFDIYKNTAEPNSVIYYYMKLRDDYDIWSPITKCVYDEEGKLFLTYETLYCDYQNNQLCNNEVVLHNWREHNTELYRFHLAFTQADRSDSQKVCDARCILNTDYSIYNFNEVRSGLECSNFQYLTDDMYLFEDQLNHLTICIYVDSNNDLTSIVAETEDSVIKFTRENSSWIGHYSSKLSDSFYDFYPCENILPKGVSDNDFLIPKIDSDDCKVFYSMEEYYDYIVEYNNSRFGAAVD